MTDNQNMNKTTMKDVQLQHFLFKTASRMSEMFPKTLFFFVFDCSFFFLLFTGNYYNWVSCKTFLFPFATRKLI